MADPFERRRDALRDVLADAGATAAVLYPGPNLQYLAGFRGEPDDRYTPLVVPREGDATFVAPDGYVDQVREYAAVDAVRAVAANDPAEVADGALDVLPSSGSVLLDGQARAAFARHLYDVLGDRVEPADPAMADLRLTKDGRELDALRRAAGLSDAVSAEVRAMGTDAVGLTERELAAEIRGRLHAAGGERVSFPVVVAAGPNGARPALRHGGREIRRGEPVVLDFGAFVDGYASDQTRTVVFAGDPPEGFEAAHAAVRAALEAGIEAVEPGEPVGAVDRAATTVLEEWGFGDAIRHDTGHGVGAEAHEAPAVAAESGATMREGMVFSVEPGVYPGAFGVRLEDVVAVTGGGAERLNGSPYGWRPTPG